MKSFWNTLILRVHNFLKKGKNYVLGVLILTNYLFIWPKEPIDLQNKNWGHVGSANEKTWILKYWLPLLSC